MTDDEVFAARVRNATKAYPGVVALDGADFDIAPGEVRALLGRNGAGKSTLIRMIAGVDRPDSGEVHIGGSPLGDGGVRRAVELGVSTVYQELSLVPWLSVAENMFLGAWPRTGPRIDYELMGRESNEVLGQLGLHIDAERPVATLSLAEQQLVEIARAVRQNPKVLILDEPTSALAAAEVAMVLDVVGRIAASGVAVIYVSHRLDEIRQVADGITVMRDGRTIKTIPAKGATTQEIVELMLGGVTEAATQVTPIDIDRSGTPLLAVRDLVVAPKITGVTFDLHPGEVLGLGGLLGSGRTELLRALAGFDPIAAGHIEVEGERIENPTNARMKRLGVGLTPENRKAEGIVPMLGVDENMVMSDFGRVSTGPSISTGLVHRAATELVRRLGIKTARPQTPIADLSGGNQQKAVIGRWLHADSRILLLDEPTRGVDVEAKAQIYRLVRELAAAGAGVLFVSGELEELPLVCDRVLTLHGGGIRSELHGAEITVDNILAATMAV
ncbi:sugar ABC transporter ATP-binding protein [Actinoalloteichus hymeniacidonis]|uniref:Monosaccharide ABC transporter ATP-binding protein, CUT2 family n=1 Tax=Actinoalloteichus hymeniacidonis TaxID=340345 RepID=A0AAC9MYW7_9PSEU|nr:sugar ABC transporter ATP-binding protein [Actinoalloteichus hymeniacidonis]AOS63301.1 monosaccharide ABC transporter ATP-binding protein, CUT2 family [Actinoalloteichus hymeniacidonis]MBB5908660.1 simple sugar transport system ATP-binding protein [Actinoalloteichus hymeniacidonis]